MLEYVDANLFELPVQTLVNATNTQGIMGGGVALAFRNKFPAMYYEYREACSIGYHTVERPYLWRSENWQQMPWILNLATKDNIWEDSTLTNIALGLTWLCINYKAEKIESIGFPALGCGLGNLKWENVKIVMDSFLSLIEIPVYVCLPR